MAIYYDPALNTFYDTRVHENLPENVIEINEEKHAELLNAIIAGLPILEDLSIGEPAPSPAHEWNGKAWVHNKQLEAEQLKQAKAAKLAEVNNLAEQLVSKVSGADTTPEFEVKSWAIQALEAKAWNADPTAKTPVLDTIAASRGIKPDLLKAAALRKTIAYEQLAGHVVGMRQRVETRIEQARTLEELEKIDTTVSLAMD